MLVIADLNNDNHLLDIIVANSGTKPIRISVADFNNDHWLDLAVANFIMSNVGVLLGYRQGNFSEQTTYSTGIKSQPYSIAVGDFNHNNRLDIAIANYGTNNVAILLGHPSKHSVNSTANDVPILLGEYYATFHSQTTYSTGSSSRPYSIAIGDLNNDTRIDIVIANSGSENLGILLGYGNGTFDTKAIGSVGLSASPWYVVVDDFN
jgi:hypothetical protein